jgi:type I restriction enzyme R subunit
MQTIWFQFTILTYKCLQTTKPATKTFVRTYNFLSAILLYGSVDWEKLSIFLNLLVNKLPRPNNGDDLSEGILESVDLEGYRVVAQETMSISLADENAEIDPIPVSTDVGIPVPELDTLTHILETFHDIWGDCDWTDEDRIRRQVADQTSLAGMKLIKTL